MDVNRLFMEEGLRVCFGMQILKLTTKSRYKLRTFSNNAAALSTQPYLQKIFRLSEDDVEGILPAKHIELMIRTKGNETWYIEEPETKRLRGFIIFGPFHTPTPYFKFSDSKISQDLFQILMLASDQPGLGRILIAWALSSPLAHNFPRGAILEVLGGSYNQRAIDLYKKFGFQYKMAYDTQTGPRTQMRNHLGEIMYYMVRSPQAGEPLLDWKNIKDLLFPQGVGASIDLDQKRDILMQRLAEEYQKGGMTDREFRLRRLDIKRLSTSPMELS